MAENSENQATRLVRVALESGARFYVYHPGAVVVDPGKDDCGVFELEGRKGRNWLVGLCYKNEERVPPQGVLRQAVETLEALAAQTGKAAPQELIDQMEANAAIDREAATLGKAPSQLAAAPRLVQLALERGLYLFHDQRGEPYAQLPTEPRETFRVNGKELRRWLAKVQWEEEKTAPSNEALSSALNLMCALGVFEGAEHPLYVRVAWHEGALWYDQGNGRAVRVTERGWETIQDPPVLFRHFPHQLPQPDLVTRVLRRHTHLKYV